MPNLITAHRAAAGLGLFHRAEVVRPLAMVAPQGARALLAQVHAAMTRVLHHIRAVPLLEDDHFQRATVVRKADDVLRVTTTAHEVAAAAALAEDQKLLTTTLTNLSTRLHLCPKPKHRTYQPISFVILRSSARW